MKTHSNTLSATVAARNEVNELTNTRYSTIILALAPFIGQRILKVDGTLLKKVKEALPEFDAVQGFGSSSWYSTGHGYSLVLNIKTCHGVEPHGCVYADSTLYLGKLRDGVLEGLYDAPTLKANFTEQYVIQAREEVKGAEKILREVESKLYYFGK